MAKEVKVVEAEVEVVGAEETAAAPEVETQAEDAASYDKPVYGQVDEKTQARMDNIINETLASKDPMAAHKFGDKSKEELTKLTEELIDLTYGEETKSVFEAMREALGNSSDTSAVEQVAAILKKKGSRLKDKGQKTVKEFLPMIKEGASTALSVAGTLASVPLAKTASLMGNKNAKQWLVARKRDQEIEILSEDPETIKAATYTAIEKLEEQEAALQDAFDHAPELDRRITELFFAQKRAFIETSIYIGAGEELVRRLNEDVIPPLEADDTKKFDEDHVNKIEYLKEFSRVVDGKLGILGLTLAETCNSGAVLRALKENMAQSVQNLQTALVTGVSQARNVVATQLMTVDALEMGLAATKFHESTDGLRALTTESLAHVNEQTIKGRFDSAERINNIAADLEKTTEVIAAHKLAVEEDINGRKEARKKLSASMQRLKNTQETSVPLLNTGATAGETKTSPKTVDKSGIATEVTPTSDFGSIADIVGTPANDVAKEEAPTVPLKSVKGKVVGGPNKG